MIWKYALVVPLAVNFYFWVHPPRIGGGTLNLHRYSVNDTERAFAAIRILFLHVQNHSLSGKGSVNRPD